MKTRWQDWFMLALAAWLFISPFWMAGYASSSSVAAWNSYILAVLVAAFAIAALATPQRWEEWVQLVLGVWLVIALTGRREAQTAVAPEVGPDHAGLRVWGAL